MYHIKKKFVFIFNFRIRLLHPKIQTEHVDTSQHFYCRTVKKLHSFLKKNTDDKYKGFNFEFLDEK